MTLTQRSPVITNEMRRRLRHEVEHASHILSGQGPMGTFIHHNTLHGLQHLPFEAAVAEASAILGAKGYLSLDEYRRLYAEGRITAEDVEEAIRERGEPEDEVIARLRERSITAREIRRAALLYGIDGATPERLRWMCEEEGALERLSPEVAAEVRAAILEQASEAEIAAERLRRLPRTEAIELRAQTLERSKQILRELFGGLGERRSHRDVLLALTGEDIHEPVHAYLTRYCAAFLDEGMAAWEMFGRSLGFYDALRVAAARDPSLEIDGGFLGLRAALEALPPLASDAVLESLARLGVEEARWRGYLERLLVALPGFSGMASWREGHPKYPAQEASPIHVMDLLAVRLFYEEAAIRRVCRGAFQQDGDAESLRRYFQARPAELVVRRALFAGELPDFLAEEARSLVEAGPDAVAAEDHYQAIACGLWIYRQSAATGGDKAAAICRGPLRLFQLCQHLGVSAGELDALSPDTKQQMIAELDAASPSALAPIWQAAYEVHYRDEVLNALVARHNERAPEAAPRRAQAQIAFCIDDREESIRRHIEELNDAIETLSCAGFFGVAMNYCGLDDRAAVPLCPVVVTPAHDVIEVPRPEAADSYDRHVRGRLQRERARGAYGEILRSVFSSYFLVDLIGLVMAIPLVARVLSPRLYERIVGRVNAALLPPVITELTLDADEAPAGEGKKLGFTTSEQIDRVAGTLRTLGLTRGFAPFVILMGHGSISRNNPHLSAYDCGACGGNHGGPNARAFAAMANRPEVRGALRERGIDIPDDTWFIGAEHNTCTDIISYWDLDDMPKASRAAFARLVADLDRASVLSAEERCRKFESAPAGASPARCFDHVNARAADISQARPELGHATNACAIIGRRALTKGVFLDRRVFLVSYDPAQDPEGKILENILLAVGPVGAGISLEYYFSTVDNVRYGCGTKVPHNVCGLFGVIEGTQGDLRTGLPRQMIEIHEPMRLQIIVEAKPEVLGVIYERQPSLRELIGNAWAHLISIDPTSGAPMIFIPARGFVPWGRAPTPISAVSISAEYFRGKMEFLPPVLVRRPARERRAAKEVAHA